MPSTENRPDLAPRDEPGSVRSFSYALVVHLLLAAALTWGVSWKSNDPTVSFEAELWSSLPQEAAPALESPPPPPPAPPAPEPLPVAAPTPAPPPLAKVEATPDPDIALEREKQRKKKEIEAKKTALALVEKADKAAKEKIDKAEKVRKEKEVAQAKAKAAAQAKLEAQKLEVQREQLAKKQAVADAKLRKENMDRMNALAGATGGPEAKGSALQSSGPSASYGGKVRAKVKPNVIFTEDIVGNPVAEVEVRTTLDGTITSQRLVKSSGNKAWDDAVITAIIRTVTLPRDVDGRVPTPLIISFRPKD